LDVDANNEGDELNMPPVRVYDWVDPHVLEYVTKYRWGDSIRYKASKFNFLERVKHQIQQ